MRHLSREEKGAVKEIFQDNEPTVRPFNQGLEVKVGKKG
jgi:hypothetical protein